MATLRRTQQNTIPLLTCPALAVLQLTAIPRVLKTTIIFANSFTTKEMHACHRCSLDLSQKGWDVEKLVQASNSISMGIAMLLSRFLRTPRGINSQSHSSLIFCFCSTSVLMDFFLPWLVSSLRCALKYEIYLLSLISCRNTQSI